MRRSRTEVTAKQLAQTQASGHQCVWVVRLEARASTPAGLRRRKVQVGLCVMLTLLYAPFVSAGSADATVKRNAPKLSRVSVDANPCPVAFEELQQSLSDHGGMVADGPKSPRTATLGMPMPPVAEEGGAERAPRKRAPPRGVRWLHPERAPHPMRRPSTKEQGLRVGNLQRTIEPAGHEGLHEFQARVRAPGVLR